MLILRASGFQIRSTLTAEVQEGKTSNFAAVIVQKSNPRLAEILAEFDETISIQVVDLTERASSDTPDRNAVTLSIAVGSQNLRIGRKGKRETTLKGSPNTANGAPLQGANGSPK